MKKQKICIVGNGLTGLTVALVLSKLNISIDLIGKFDRSKFFDNRTTAISPSNYEFLLKFLKKNNSQLFWPSKKIDLYHEQSGEYFRFMNFENQGKNLMYTIENFKLRNIFFNQVKNRKNLRILSGEVKKIDEKNSIVFFKNKKFYYDCILLCVGRNSKLNNDLVGERTINSNSKEIAFTTIVKHKSNIINSKQYFFKEGPMAILPLNEKKFSLVWSVKENYDLNVMNNLIRERLKKILNLEKINFSKIDFFPISFKFNINFLKNNVLVLGEGSYNIHPIAGQGFNLILRDIRELFEEIEKCLFLGMQIKNSQIFYKFMSSRKSENFIFGMGVNVINKFFRYNKITHPFKKVILKDLNKFKFLKDINLKISDKGFFK